METVMPQKKISFTWLSRVLDWNVMTWKILMLDTIRKVTLIVHQMQKFHKHSEYIMGTSLMDKDILGST